MRIGNITQCEDWYHQFIDNLNRDLFIIQVPLSFLIYPKMLVMYELCMLGLLNEFPTQLISFGSPYLKELSLELARLAFGSDT